MLTAAVVLFVVGWLPVFALRSEGLSARRAVAAPDERRAIWNAVGTVAVHVTLAEAALTDPEGPAPGLASVAIGMAIFCVGLGFWALARHTLVGTGRRLDPSVPPPALVTSGPFAIVRHPLALGMVILALGPAVAAGRPLTWVSFATVVVALGWRCVQDERELDATFGEAYARYVKAVPSRLVPFVW